MLLTTKQAAEWLTATGRRTTPDAIRKARQRGHLPPPAATAARVSLWDTEQLDAWKPPR